MTDKPSRNEDEYFAREEREKLERQRQQALKLAQETERKSHYMKCPKDGHDLITESFHGVQVDRCNHCNGIWFDGGEVDTIMAHEDKGLLGRVLGDVLTTFKGKKK
jgi:uncharacterized protein